VEKEMSMARPGLDLKLQKQKVNFKTRSYKHPIFIRSGQTINKTRVLRKYHHFLAFLVRVSGFKFINIKVYSA